MAAPMPEAAPPVATVEPAAQPKLDRLTRKDFNRRAIELDVPLFWRDDADGNGIIEPAELAVTVGHALRRRDEFVTNGDWTSKFRSIYEQMLIEPSAAGLTPEEKKRMDVVRVELGQGRPTLIESDFSHAEAGEKAFVAHVMKAATLVERIYASQKGTLGMDSTIPPNDTASAALFYRNQGPFCVAPKTEKDPDCSALADKPKRIFGLYPAASQADKGFCGMLEKQPNSRDLLDHFGVVVAKGSAFESVPYTVAYEKDMQAVSAELEEAARGLGDDETALAKYLVAAAQSFRDNDWERANQAWVAMGPNNSKYYLRVAPDEVYYEPCAWKAGFQVSFARINKESLEWQQKLEPIKQEMENDLAARAGAPYRARQVKFKLPDFIDIVLNAGDSRAPYGATVGESLPNWGPVAEHGGRTVTMTNLYTDGDSQKSLVDQMSALYCKATMAKASPDPKLAIMGVVLHEAAHNLGPAHDYKANGKVDHAAFGGPLASTLEELKAQTAAMYFPSKLVAKKLVSAEQAELAEVRELTWAFGNVALGMYDAEGKPKNYSQLASIQLGSLISAGAVEWKAGESAANGTDQGCYELHLDKYDAAVAKLMSEVLGIKAKGDRAAAEKLKKRWVDADDEWKKRRELIAERWLRAPRATFVYAIEGV
jgi:hypothetical protein